MITASPVHFSPPPLTICIPLYPWWKIWLIFRVNVLFLKHWTVNATLKRGLFNPVPHIRNRAVMQFRWCLCEGIQAGPLAVKPNMKEANELLYGVGSHTSTSTDEAKRSIVRLLLNQFPTQVCISCPYFLSLMCLLYMGVFLRDRFPQ